MTQTELEQALVGLAERWRAKPHLSNDHSEGVRYGELTGALKRRFNVVKQIRAVGDSATNYQVK